jgi:Domain of unknown function (DUF4145)
METEGRQSILSEVASGIMPDPLNHLCGRCGRPSWFQLRSAVFAGEFFVGSGFGGHDRLPVVAAVYQCPGCKSATLFEFQSFSVYGDPHVSLPRAFPAATAIPWDDLPDELRQDHAEANSCHLAGQYRAATLVARGVLQKAVRMLTDVRGSLKEELDSLVSEGVITKQLRLSADEVRLTGNDAAHPEELQVVTESEATDSLAFLDDFLQTTIVLPRRQKDRAAKRSEPDA